MRLINTSTGELEEYVGSDVPVYVALSHRWSNDEITFKDYTKRRGKDSLGHRKIGQFCNVARSRSVRHAWIDTVCIDKRSSAELSEAINSMWQWYENALECYVYLNDVDSTDVFECMHQLRSSVWFTRGWTLQELLAPKVNRFYNSTWTELGVCAERSIEHEPFTPISSVFKVQLMGLLAEITSIPEDVLQDPGLVSSRNVAEKFSWLSNRKTTREEDMAYCALGLMGVNMPLLYGEGRRAWDRLQEEIIRTTHDETIFAWFGSAPASSPALFTEPILAAHPSAFQLSASQTVVPDFANRLAYSITNQGLQLHLTSSDAQVLRVSVDARDNPHSIHPGHRLRAASSDLAASSSLDRRLVLLPLCKYQQNIDKAKQRQQHDPSCWRNVSLVFIQQLCGHYDRILTPCDFVYDRSIKASPPHPQTPEFQILVHSTERMRTRCAQRFAKTEHRYSHVLSADPDLQRVVSDTRPYDATFNPHAELGDGASFWWT